MTTQQPLDPFPIGPGSRALIQAAGWLARTTHRKDAQDFTSEMAHALYYGISFAVYYPEEARAILAQETLFGPEGHEAWPRTWESSSRRAPRSATKEAILRL